jgi:hypothetical protein
MFKSSRCLPFFTIVPTGGPYVVYLASMVNNGGRKSGISIGNAFVIAAIPRIPAFRRITFFSSASVFFFFFTGVLAHFLNNSYRK